MRSNKKTSVNLDDSDCDQKEGYRNLTNQNTTDNSSYDNLEFINPVFKKHKDVQITDQNNYSTLARHHSLDDNKATEEVEMGIKNFGYMPERRPESWESSLSTEFHPYAIDTPIRHPSVGLEMTETGADNRLSTISKSSHYSAVKDNPYMIPAEKRNEYEDLAIMQAKYHRQIANGARAAGSKKANMVYEPAVVAERTAKYRKKSIASNGYEDNSSYCHLIFTILVALLAIIALIMVFMLLFGVINPKACSNCEVDPITSKQTQDPGNKINDQFELLKGNLSLLKQLEKSSSDMLVELNKQKSLVNLLTKELEVQKRLTSVLKNDILNANVDAKLLKGTVTKIVLSSDKDVQDKKLEILGKDLNDFHDTSKRDYKTLGKNWRKSELDLLDKIANSTINVKKLSLNLEELDSFVKDNFTKLQSNHNKMRIEFAVVSSQIKNITTIQGPRGFNGTKGNDADFGSCVYRRQTRTAPVSDHVRASATADAKSNVGDAIIGASCSSTSALITKLSEANGDFSCVCKSVQPTQNNIECTIHYWSCPK